MNDRETRRYNCFGRIDSFGQDNSADFAPDGEGSPAASSEKALLTAADVYLSELEAPDSAAAKKASKAARAEANALAAKFIAHEMPGDFVQNLRDDVDAVREAQDVLEAGDQGGVESTATVGRLIRDGMKERTYLDAIVRNKYVRNPAKLAAWESASRIDRAPQREKKPVPPASGTIVPK